MGYGRIYLVSGGAAFLSAKIGQIQENDGRYKITRPFVERGQRRGNPPTPQAHNKEERKRDLEMRRSRRKPCGEMRGVKRWEGRDGIVCSRG